jgi:hypothetical protein
MSIFLSAISVAPHSGIINTGSGPPPPTQTGSGFDAVTWNINNVDGDSSTTGSLTISPTPTGSLIVRFSCSGGNDNGYGYDSGLHGQGFPFGGQQGKVLPAGITTVEADVNFIGYILDSSTPQRFHLYIALYYKLSSTVGPYMGTGPYGWLDTQRRFVYDSRDGGWLSSGSVETYDPGDSFGAGFALGTINTGSTYHFSIDINQQAIACMNAYGIPTTTGYQLQGIEIGEEGFHIDAVNSNWLDYLLVTTGSG